MNVRSLRSDRALARTRSLRSDRAEHVFGRCVRILFELLSDDSRFLRKAFRKEESISKKYLSKKVSTFFFFGDLDVNFVVTVFDSNTYSEILAAHAIWWERNRRKHGEKELPYTLLLKTIDKNVRNRLSTSKRQGDRKMDAGLGVWFGSRG
uniref:Uncharacterized protein n=1 Tax=Brassica oleracea var. oleracea TaxID=109376 RepID=A0A0D3AUN0_BRAOL